MALLLQGQSQKVVDEYGKTQLGNPTADATLQTTLAAAYGVLGKPEPAAAALNAALKADPNHAPGAPPSGPHKGGGRDFDGALATVDERAGEGRTQPRSLEAQGRLAAIQGHGGRCDRRVPQVGRGEPGFPSRSFALIDGC